MVWIDCEMTGLDPRKDKIIEIAVSVLSSVTLSGYTAENCIGASH